MNILHITNGDSAVHKMRAAGIEGEIVPWRDVLHDGPVPACDTLEALSSIRAEFLSSIGWVDHNEAIASFRERDTLLAEAGSFDRVILWFEHDLYDQLQLLQILDWFATHLEQAQQLFLINHDDYLGVIPPEQMRDLLGQEKSVDAPQLRSARQLWAAFTHRTPEKLAAAFQDNLSEFPFMHAAIYRLLQFLPQPGNGLNRTEQTILRLVKKGLSAPDNLFEAYQQTEWARFMGDSSFWLILEELASGERPLLATRGDTAFVRPAGYPLGADFLATRLRLTEDGITVMAGRLDAMALRSIDRWVGGTHLQPRNLWRWDAIRGKLIAD